MFQYLKKNTSTVLQITDRKKRCDGLFADDNILLVPTKILSKKNHLNKVYDCIKNKMTYGISKCDKLVIKPKITLYLQDIMKIPRLSLA
jgi:hypothetical protein